MASNTRDLSTIIKPVTDGEHFRTITGRNPRDRFTKSHNYDTAKNLHDGQRKQFEAMPDLADACEQLAHNVEAEQRQDDAIKLNELRVDSLGALIAPQRGEIIPGAARLQVMEQAWAQLVNRAPRDVPRRLRSNVNAWLRDSKGTAVARTMEAPSGRARDCFAMVSDRYQPHDAGMVAHEVARAMPAECKGESKYRGDGGRYEIEAVLARPFEVDGDLHRVIIGVRSADNGIMSQQIWFKAWRLKCLNGMFIADKHLLRRVRHTGEVRHLRDQFRQGLTMARNAIESFSGHWKRAQRERFVDAETGHDLTGPEALRRLVGRGQVVVPHVRPSDLVGHFQAAWETEPGDNVADVLNAVTNAAHVNSWKSPWTTETLEDTAGQILYGNVQALPALSAKQALALAA